MDGKISLIIPLTQIVEPYFTDCMQRVKEETENKNFEVIISEDGPKTDEIKSKYPEWAIVIEHSEISGYCCAIRRALEICTGDFVNFLGPQDLMERGYYYTVIDSWNKHKNAQCIEFGYSLNEIVYFCKNLGGQFSNDMIWNKSYIGNNARQAVLKYEPPLVTTFVDDLLWNIAYQSISGINCEKEEKILFNRTTTVNEQNTKDEEKILDYSKKFVEIDNSQYNGILRKLLELKFLKPQPKKIVRVNTISLTFSIFNECNQKCPYCVNRNYRYVKDGSEIDSASIVSQLLNALKKWDSLYGLPENVSISGGEPTLLDLEEIRKVFEAYPNTLFTIYSNGYNVKNWIDKFDNVVYRIHSIDGKIDVEWLENPRVQNYCYVGEENDPIFIAWKKLKEKYPKILALSDIRKRTYADPKQHELCRQVEGVWVVTIWPDKEPTVAPCCGTLVNRFGTIENRPNKCDVDCSNCTNAPDNYMYY